MIFPLPVDRYIHYYEMTSTSSINLCYNDQSVCMLILLELPFLEALVVGVPRSSTNTVWLNDMFVFMHKLPTQDTSNALTEEMNCCRYLKFNLVCKLKK